MKGKRHKQRKIRLAALALSLSGFYLFGFPDVHPVKSLIEYKAAELMGDKLFLKIGEVSGGIFQDVIFKDVELSLDKERAGEKFSLERMEISYCIRKKIFHEKEKMMESVGMYFDEKNPFLNGFIKFYKFSDRIEFFGLVAPALFGEAEKKGIKGILFKRTLAKYECDVLYNGKYRLTGEVDTLARTVDLKINYLSDKKSPISLLGKITDENEIKLYLRLDKADILGLEIIGDLWVNCRNFDSPLFLAKMENIIINKKPFCDFSVSGKIFPEEKKIFIEKLKLDNGLALTGDISIEAYYPVDLKVQFEDVKLEDLAKLFGHTKNDILGTIQGEINFKGNAASSDAKGRLYVGDGMMGAMKFRSVFATLEGKLPLIGVIDSRIMTDKGNIRISGEMDFTKAKENKIFEKLTFETDNRVAVWDSWQISKEPDVKQIQVRKDRLTLTAAFLDDKLKTESKTSASSQKEIGFAYKIDKTNSVKLEFQEEKDFFGIEHKVKF